MSETRQQPSARIRGTLHRLGQSGSVTGPRLSDCADLSVEDLRWLVRHGASNDQKLRNAANMAIRLRTRDRRVEPNSGMRVAQRTALSFRPSDALVQRLSDDHFLVLGNTDAGLEYGRHLRDLSPALAVRAFGAVGTMVASGTAGLHAASALQSLRQSGAIFAVTDAYRPLLQWPQAAASDGLLGFVRPGGTGIAHLRLYRVGTALRTVASVTGFLWTIIVIAGQARTDRTLRDICFVVDDLKEMSRDEQISQVIVAGQKVGKVLVIAEEVGELTPAVLAQLPDRQQLEQNVDRAAREVIRLQRRLDRLPTRAGERLKVLESTAPDALLAVGLYAEAERTLSATEILHLHAFHERGDRAAHAITRFELAARKERISAGKRMTEDLATAMRQIETAPGTGWFSRVHRDQIRTLARQVQQELPTLAGYPLT